MNMPSGKYKLASSEIACEKFDGEYVLLNLSTGHYFALSKSASVFMDGLLAGYDVGALIELGDRFAGDDGFSKLLTDMVAHALVAQHDGTDADPIADDWTEQLRAVADPPTIEAFDDLSDLVISDPIHDVDEAAGWPIAKRA